MTAETASPKVFISYSHKDGVWKDLVLDQLRVLESAGELIVWDDERIEAGDEWLLDIETAMSSVDVAVLLISADFLTSPFIRFSEIPRLLDRRQTEGLRVIPLFVRPCAWSAVEWLAGLQGRPRDGRSLSELRRSQAEKHLAALALEIREILGHRAPSNQVLVHQPEVPPLPASAPTLPTLRPPDPRPVEVPPVALLPEPISGEAALSRETSLEFRSARRSLWVSLICLVLGWWALGEAPSGILSVNPYYILASVIFSIASFLLALNALRKLIRQKAKRARWAKAAAIFVVVLAGFSVSIVALFYFASKA